MLQPAPPLAAIRLSRGLTQTELARRVGIHKSWVSRFEHGQVQPWPAVRGRIAAELKVDEALLWG